METKITTELIVLNDGGDFGGQYQSQYVVKFFADGKQIGKNEDVLAGVEGWAMGAFLAPGAHQDIDGSGLALWGDSQPGGWRCADGDGAVSGKPQLQKETYWGKCHPFEPITIFGGAGFLDIEICPTDIPEWESICNRLHDYDTIEEESGYAPEDYDTIYEQAEKIRDEVRQALEDALESTLDGSHYPKLPSDEDMYDELEELDELEDLPIRSGNYLGCGPVVAWMRNGEYHAIPHPDEQEIRGIIQDITPDIVQAIQKSLDLERMYS